MKLGYYIDIINGFPFSSKKFSNYKNGFPVIKIKELKKNSICITKDTCYVSESLELQKYVVIKNDILIALTGNPPSKGTFDAIVGRCSKYNLANPAYLNQRVCKVRSNSSKLLDLYLYYFLSTDNTTLELAYKCTGSANQANISSNDIKNIEINLPSLQRQQHIVNTIGSVDDLIENYESRIIQIVSILENSIKFYNSKVYFDVYEPEIIKSGITKFDHFKNYLDTSSIDGVNIISHGEKIVENKRPSRANMQPIKNSVWFAKMKGSYKNLIITEKDEDIINDCILSTGFLGIKATSRLPLSLLTAFIISKDFNEQRNLNSVGTTMAGINNKTFSKILVPFLNKNEVIEYDKKYKYLIDELSLLRKEINELKIIKLNLLNKYF